MAHQLESHPSAAIVFCNVAPVPHDPGLGYVPAYQIDRGRHLRSVGDLRGGVGLGAGMAVRRDFVTSLGGFDESFGPGARFPSADDWDLAIRALLNGYQVYETPELTVIHDGFRTFKEGKQHAARDWVALGAVCAKPLRARRWEMLTVAAWVLVSKAIWPPLCDLLSFRKPRGVGRITDFVKGFLDGVRVPVQRAQLRFEDTSVRPRRARLTGSNQRIGVGHRRKHDLPFERRIRKQRG
jgi:hypothetical protein